QRRHGAHHQQRPPQHPPRVLGRVRSQQHADRKRQRRDQQARPDRRRQPMPAVLSGIDPLELVPGSAHQLLPPETTLISLNIGRYIATTMPPTMPPITTIITGSMMEVSVSTAVSTSAS